MKNTGSNQNGIAAERDPLAPFALQGAGDAWLDALRDAARNEPIARVGAYELIEEIGRGGQAVVYRARRIEDGQSVALKIFHKGRQLDRELSVTARLDHPSIVTALDSFEWESRACLVMPLIEGEPITEHCDVAAQSPERTLETARLFAELAGALHHAHQQGVIHRDIKPSNVLVEITSGRATPHVLDFGIARLDRGEHADANLTSTDRLALTPAYASPEQAQGDEAPDIRTDIYSLGVLLFRCVTGAMPYAIDRGNVLRTLETIRTRPPLAPRQLNPHVSREFDAVIRRALEKSPAERYQSMEAFAADLRAIAEGRETSVGVPNFFTSLKRTAREHTAASALLVALIGAIVLGSVVSTGFAWRAQSAAQREAEARQASEELNRVLQQSLGAAVASRGGQSALLLDSLDDIAQRAEAELGAYPEHAADLLLTVGTTYRSLWRYELSVPPLRRALELYETLHDPPELKVARALSVLGTALTAMRDDEAVGAQERALAIRRERLGETHADTLESMVKLGYALHQAQDPPDFERATELMTGALAGYREIYPEAHRETGSCIHNLAYLTLRSGEPDRGKALYREAIEEFRAAGATDDPYYAEVLHTYSSLLNTDGTAEECLALLVEAIPLVRRIYGDERTRPLIDRRVRALLRLDRPNEALAAHRESLVILLDELADAGAIPRDRAASLSALVRIEPDSSDEGAVTLIELATSLEGEHGLTLYRAAHTSGRIAVNAGRAAQAQAIASRMLEDSGSRRGEVFGNDLLRQIRGKARTGTAPPQGR